MTEEAMAADMTVLLQLEEILRGLRVPGNKLDTSAPNFRVAELEGRLGQALFPLVAAGLGDWVDASAQDERELSDQVPVDVKRLLVLPAQARGLAHLLDDIRVADEVERLRGLGQRLPIRHLPQLPATSATR
jgi:hypothetical protein